jgi:hypothetical protein
MTMTEEFPNRSDKWNFTNDEERRKAIEAEARATEAKAKAKAAKARYAMIRNLIWAIAITTISVGFFYLTRNGH